MTRRKQYFAQNNVLTATGHRAAYFDTLEEAREFLSHNHGGVIKQRARLWKEIEHVPAEKS